ncbi:MAG: hypothetical protein KDA24_01165 [Deltaproteobacteria bacterium]|nr:hypothetical protein [Deltaproteobacteria bacterium]
MIHEARAWATLLVLFVGVRLWLLLGDPSRFWAAEETYQTDIAVALARGEGVEPLERYLYPLFAGGSLAENLLLVPLAAVFGPSWWLLKGVALLIALGAAATWVVGLRMTCGVRPALGLGLLLALSPPTSMSLQLFLFGNHAEAALPLALSAVGLMLLLDPTRSLRGRRRLALGLGLLSGLACFFVYSHLLVLGLQGLLLVASSYDLRERVRLAVLAAVGVAVGLTPWVWCRRALGEPLSFTSHIGRQGASLRDAFASMPWLGNAEGRPWLELLSPTLLDVGSVSMGATRTLLLLSLVGALGLGVSRRLRSAPHWVLPSFVGSHGLLLFGLLAGSQIEPRYAQQLIPSGLVSLSLLLAAAVSRGGGARFVVALAALPLLGSVLDTVPLLHAPQSGVGTLAEQGILRFPRGRQSMTMQGFTRAELPGIARWLEEQPPGDADLGFGLGLGDATDPLLPRISCSDPGPIRASRLRRWQPPGPVSGPDMMRGYGAASVVRHCGDLESALREFEGSADERADFEEGARWMAARL